MYGVEGSILDATSQDIYVYLYVYTFVCSCLDINPIDPDVLSDFLTLLCVSSHRLNFTICSQFNPEW